MEELYTQYFAILTKLSSLWGSLLGSSVFLGFLKPKNKKEILFRIFVSVVTAATMTALVHEILEIDNSWQISLGVGFILGIFSWVFLSLLAISVASMEKNNEGLLEIIKIIFKK